MEHFPDVALYILHIASFCQYLVQFKFNGEWSNGNGVRNGVISNMLWDVLKDWYKVNPIGQWENPGMGFAHTFGTCIFRSYIQTLF